MAGEHRAEVGHGAPGTSSALWAGADRLLERATLRGVLAHKVGPLAANRLRRTGSMVPDALRQEERSASVSMLTATPLVARVRDATDGRLMLIKGPEVARLYPDDARRFGDIDVIADHPETLQRSLLARGFVDALEPGEETPDEHHHLLPLKTTAIPLRVEVHQQPYWAEGSTPPRLDEIFEACVPSALGIEGVLAPAPHHHALILASHAWSHAPLDTLRDLLDVAAAAALADRSELDRNAAAWGLRRIWRTTQTAIDALFYEDHLTLPLRSWARHLPAMRSQTVLENHLRRWLAAFWQLPPHAALARLPLVLVEELRPRGDETRSDKLARIARAVRAPRRSASRAP